MAPDRIILAALAAAGLIAAAGIAAMRIIDRRATWSDAITRNIVWQLEETR